MKDMRIVFMGTPDFAAAILERLVETGRNVVGVFSQPDKPVGRKQTVTPTATKVVAEKYGIPVLGKKSPLDAALKNENDFFA